MEKLYKEDLVDIINDIQHPIWISDCNTNQIMTVNRTAVKMLGFGLEELLNMTTFDLRSEEEKTYYKVHNQWRLYTFGMNNYYKLQKKDGGEILAEMHFRETIYRKHNSIITTVYDLTDRINYERNSRIQQEEIKRKNSELNDVFERISDAFIALDKHWNIKYINRTALLIFNLDRTAIGKNLWNVLPMYKGTHVEQDFINVMKSQEPGTFVIEGKINPRWYKVSVFPSPEGVSIYGVDITLSRAYEEQLKSSLRQKELLLKEVHHRIKNNLQIIISILNLQSYYIKDPKALEIFRQSQNRIRSMALIHEKLYKSDNLNSINLSNYISDVVTYLFTTYSINKELVNLSLDLENIYLDSNTAISFGLIVNELVSNSLKYAFPEKRQGTIKITARKNSPNMLFELSDDGVGFPKDMDFRNTTSLGLQLVNTLVDQLNGDLEMTNKQGTTFRIGIPYSG